MIFVSVLKERESECVYVCEREIEREIERERNCIDNGNILSAEGKSCN